jgi:hypothetical protein
MRRLLILLVLIAACSPSTGAPTSDAAAPTTTLRMTTTTLAAAEEPVLADQVTELGSAIFDPNAIAESNLAPVSLSVDGVAIDSAPVIGVGVESNGEMEIPGAREVGWYRFGPTPRDEGSTVLAAHIAWNGRNGVFRRLASVEIGAIVTVDYEDGSSSRHVVTEIAQYPKDELPLERIFAKTGPPELTLITCGGSFNRALHAYDDNIVVYSSPLD